MQTGLYATACRHKTHRPLWRVNHLRCNHSRFNGGRRTPSAYSEIQCYEPGCLLRWRTKADYVDDLAEATIEEMRSGRLSVGSAT